MQFYGFIFSTQVHRRGRLSLPGVIASALPVPTSWVLTPSTHTCPKVTLGRISLLQVQIGCHTDDLTRASKLFRGPLVINRCCLDKPTKSITCLWGGLLYIIVPQSSKLGAVPVTVKGAVHAPYYKLGEWGPRSEPGGDRRAGSDVVGAVGYRKRELPVGGGKEGKPPSIQLWGPGDRPDHVHEDFTEEGWRGGRARA